MSKKSNMQERSVCIWILIVVKSLFIFTNFSSIFGILVLGETKFKSLNLGDYIKVMI